MKYGEYIRTRNGKIRKIVDMVAQFYVIEEVTFAEKVNRNNIAYTAEDIVNHSKNIIDLIQVGDIVEIYDVLNEDVIYIWNEEMLKAVKEDVSNGIRIKRILTKEMYEQDCFKVVE